MIGFADIGSHTRVMPRMVDFVWRESVEEEKVVDKMGEKRGNSGHRNYYGATESRMVVWRWVVYKFGVGWRFAVVFTRKKRKSK